MFVNPLQSSTDTSPLLSTTLVTKSGAQGMARNAAAVLHLSTKALCFPVLLICLVYMLPTTMSLFWTSYLTVTCPLNNLVGKSSPHNVYLMPDGPSDNPDPEAALTRIQNHARSHSELECIILAADAASLCHTYTVNKSESGPWSHKVQGQLDEKTFITCDSNNCCAIGGLGEILKTIQSWETQVDTLKDGINCVIDQALLMKQETDTTREPFTVQVKQCCWHEADGLSYASCDLHLNGHKVGYLHPTTGKWTEVDPGSMRIKEMLEKNKELTDFLFRTSQGDCKAWLKEMISKLDFEKKLELTGLGKDTAGILISVSPAIAPDVDRSSSMTMEPNAFVLLFTLVLLFLL